MKEKIIPLIRYLAIAFFDTVLSYSVYGLLLFFKAHYLVGSVCGFTVSTTSAFFLNTTFVFTPKGEKPQYTLTGLIKTFCTYGFTGVITYNILLIIWIELFHVPKMIAPILSTSFNFPINFCLNKYWAFKRH
jgi:putative flippase GtrA